jgi:mRNA-degrading endonuclease HigB of HigAB toxin-antitoxin module
MTDTNQMMNDIKTQLDRFIAKEALRKSQQKSYREKQKLVVASLPVDDDKVKSAKLKKDEYMKSYTKKNASKVKDKKTLFTNTKKELSKDYKTLTHAELIDRVGILLSL